MTMRCLNCGTEGGQPPYTCGACGTVMQLCPRCGGHGIVVQNHTPARPVRNAPPVLPMADDDVDSFAQASLQSADVDNPQEG